MTYFQCVAIMWITYAALALIGLNTRTVLEKFRVVEKNEVGINSLIGLAVIQILCWYQLNYFKDGISLVIIAVLLLTICYGLFTFWGLREILKITFLKNKWLLITLFCSTALFLFQWQRLLSTGYLSAVSPNGDIAAFAQIAQHIEHHSFDEVGRIGGANLGYVARTDVTGAYILLNFVRQLTSVNLHQILIPTLGIANLFVTHALYKIIRRTTKLKSIVVMLLAIFPQSTFMSMYLMGNYFLAQIVAMAASIMLLDVLLTCDNDILSSFKRAIKNLWVISVSVGILLLTYPHMAFVVPPMLILVAFPKVRKLQFSRFLFVMAALGASAVLVLFGKFDVAFQRMRDLAGDKINGWPLPGLYPSEVFGFQWSESLKPSNTDLVLSGVLVLLVTLSVFVSSRRKIFGFPSVSVLVWMGGTYIYMYWSSGASYRQWKWITYFQPFLITAALVPICLTVFLVLRNRKGALAFVSLTLTVLIIGNYQRTMSYAQGVVEGTYLVDRATAGLGKELGNLQQLNVKTGSYLESMWPAYFAERQVTNILDPSYYSSSQPLVAPTLVNEDFKIDDGIQFKRLASGFNLVDFPRGDTSLSIAGLSSSVSTMHDEYKISAGEAFTFQAQVSNTGPSIWLGGGLSVGSVNIGTRIISKNGIKMDLEISRSTIVAFPNYVSPNMKRIVSVDIQIDEPGNYIVEVSPVAEGLAWFSGLDNTNAKQIRVRVQ